MKAVPNIRAIFFDYRKLGPRKTAIKKILSPINIGVPNMIKTIRIGDIGRGELKDY